MNDAGVMNLIEAVVKQAANDYRIARKNLRRKDISKCHRSQYESQLYQTERFFKSQWFYLMGGSPDMFMMLKRDCNRGDFRMTTMAWGNLIKRRPAEKKGG